MLLRPSARRAQASFHRIAQMTAHLSNGAVNNSSNGTIEGLSLHDLPKSHVFTQSLPPDPDFKTPSTSAKALRENLGPRMVKGALYTYVRPEGTESPELLGASKTAMKDIGMREGEDETEEFKQVFAGNKIYWDEHSETGIYPWAQCYGGISLVLRYRKRKGSLIIVQDGNCTPNQVPGIEVLVDKHAVAHGRASSEMA